MTQKWLAQIYQQLHRDGYLWARQCCLYNDEHAKEVMQLVYTKILEQKAKYDKRAALKTWFFAVIRYTAIDFLKSQPLYISLDSLPDIAAIPAETHDSPIDYTTLLNQLPQRQHQVLLLYFYHGQNLQEIATVLNLGLGSVSTHYHRGKKRLKSLLLNQQAQWQQKIK